MNDLRRRVLVRGADVTRTRERLLTWQARVLSITSQSCLPVADSKVGSARFPRRGSGVVWSGLGWESGLLDHDNLHK